MRKFYVDVPPSEFKYGETYSLETGPGYGGNKTPVYVITEASFGDYMGVGTVGIANYNYFKDKHSDLVAFGQGSHGFDAVIFRADIDPPEQLQALLDRMEDEYIILDEDAHSAVEMEKEDEAVDDEWREISSELVRPALERFLERDSEEGDLNDDIYELEITPATGDHAELYKNEWHRIVMHVFSFMQHDSPGEWFDFDPHSGNATINFRRIQEWLKIQPDSRVEEYLEPAIEALGPTGVLSPI